MEDGPYRNTRSSAGSLNRSLDAGSENPNEVFDDSENNLSTPTRQSRGDIIKGARNRTPSGHLLANSVDEIRNIFDTNPKLGSPYACKKALKQKLVNELKSVNANQRDGTPYSLGTAHNKGSKQVRSAKKAGVKDKYKQCQLDFGPIDKGDKRLEKIVTPFENQEVLKEGAKYQDLRDQAAVNQLFLESDDFTLNRTNMEGRNINKDQTEPSAIETQLEALEAEEPKVMDIRLVIQMFKDIKSDLKINNDKFDNVTVSQTNMDDKVTTLKKEVGFYKAKTDMMSGVIQKMSKTMSRLEDRVTKLESKDKKPSVTVAGMQVSTDKEEAKAQVKDFMYKNLETDVEIEDVYHVGDANPKLLVAVLQSAEDKAEILKNKTKLKDVVNENGKKFYVSDYLTPEINEKRIRQRQIYQDNKRNTASQVEMAFFRGGLKIQNETYKSKVVVPEPADILNLQPEEFDQIMKIKIPPGQKVVEGNNALIGFSIPVKTHSEINKAYIKMKLKFPQATHIVCSFQIPGIETYFCSDYCDDGDTGAGRKILDMMVRNKITSRAIFVIRITDGSKMGYKRFEAYLKAAKNAIEETSYNPLTKTEQKIDHMFNDKKPTSQTVGRGGNVRGRGRGGRIYRVVSPKTVRERLNRSRNMDYNEYENEFQFRNPWRQDERRDGMYQNDWAEGENQPVEHWDGPTDGNMINRNLDENPQ